MNGLEFFSPSEGGESYDPAAFERFKERVKKNAKFIASIRKQEQRQKKREDELLKILMKFFQSHRKQGILLLASRLLEQNIPPSFVLAILILGNENLKKEAGELLALPERSPSNVNPTEFSLITEFADASFPLRLKAEIDEWGKALSEGAEFQPFRLLETVLEKDGQVKTIAIDCMANVLQDFLNENGFAEFSYKTMYSFCEFLVHGILQKVRYDIENRKLLPEEM